MSPTHAAPDALGKAEVRAGLDGFGFAPGFRATGVACGLKESGALDLALISAATPCVAAGVFTTNLVKAAPVLLDQEVLRDAPGKVRAVIANSGCANACTGDPGLADARGMAAATAAALGCEPGQVLVLSTGVIGRRLDLAKVERGIAAAASAPADAAAAARAIMTTDTRPKVASLDVAIGGGRVALRGMAKGAGMIHPDLATMLAVITTDARVAPDRLDGALRQAATRSFNRISVDGDTSTNDTVLVLASGTSGVSIEAAEIAAFTEALTRASASLARQIARDGEGATRLIEIAVSGANTEADAHAIANRIACSPLVKTAVHGGDPNWGRVLAAAGASRVAFDPERLSLWFGPAERAIRLVERGLPLAFDAPTASRLLQEDPVLVRLDLGLGSAGATVWTCDLSAEYVAINAHYTT